jgi:hypothetical protein
MLVVSHRFQEEVTDQIGVPPPGDSGLVRREKDSGDCGSGGSGWARWDNFSEPWGGYGMWVVV